MSTTFHARHAVTGDVAGHFAASGGVSAMDRVLRSSFVTSAARSPRTCPCRSRSTVARPAVTAANKSDAREPMLAEKQHLTAGFRSERQPY